MPPLLGWCVWRGGGTALRRTAPFAHVGDEGEDGAPLVPHLDVPGAAGPGPHGVTAGEPAADGGPVLVHAAQAEPVGVPREVPAAEAPAPRDGADRDQPREEAPPVRVERAVIHRGVDLLRAGPRADVLAAVAAAVAGDRAVLVRRDHARRRDTLGDAEDEVDDLHGHG